MKRNQKPARPISTSATPAPPAIPAPSETPAASALSRFTDAAIILAFLTFLGYWGAFSYETAYFEYFNIPYYFISLNATMVFFTSVGWTAVVPIISLILIMAAVLTALEPVGKNIERRYPKPVKIMVIVIVPLSGLALFVFNLITHEEFRKIWTVETGLIYAAILGSLFLWGWLNRRYKEHKEENTWGFIALLVFGFILISYLEFRFLKTIGGEMAKKEKGFPVYKLPPPTSEMPDTSKPPATEVAVIRTSGDYLLTVPFTRDPKWAVFRNELILVKMSDSKTPLSLSLENIGPLHAPGTTPPEPESTKRLQ